MRPFRVLIAGAVVLMTMSAAAFAADAALEKKVYEDFRPSLVAVKYTWASELGNQEWTAPGVIVSDDGLVMFPINIVIPQLVPNGQMKSFKIVVPSDTEDETEIDADFQGRDSRSELAFVKASTPQKWKAIHFVDAPCEFGDQIYSIGMLPRIAGYKSFVTSGIITTRFRGATPQILVDGTLASPGGVVFNTKEEAIGYVYPREFLEGFLNNPRDPNDMSSIYSPKKTFVPTSFFIKSLNNPPKPDQRVEMAWMGCNLKGVDKDFAEFFGLKNKPSIQVTDVVPDSPADKAGLKAADIIIKMDGQPLERGDMPEELPSILNRTLQWMKPGTVVTFTVIHQKDDKPKDIAITLEARPTQAYEAHRFWASDLGFAARDVVFDDTNLRKIKRNTGGVVIALTKPNGAAYTAKLQKEDLVTQLNGKPVTDLDEFKKDYQEFRKNKPQDPVVLVVSQSDGKEQTINIEPPQSGVVPGANTDQ